MKTHKAPHVWAALAAFCAAAVFPVVFVYLVYSGRAARTRLERAAQMTPEAFGDVPLRPAVLHAGAEASPTTVSTTGTHQGAIQAEAEIPLPLSSSWIHALDPERNLSSIAPGWLPTEEAFAGHVAPLLQMTRDVSLEEARRMLLDRPDFLAVLEGDGMLADRIDTPTADDVLELWSSEVVRFHFASALWAWGYSDAIAESGLEDAALLRRSFEQQGKTSWLAIFDERVSYRWWPLLAELGLRLEFGEDR